MKPVLALLTLCLCLAGCGKKSAPQPQAKGTSEKTTTTSPPKTTTNGGNPAPAKKPTGEPGQTAGTKTPPIPEPQAELTEAEKKEFAETKAKAENGDPVAQRQLGDMYGFGFSGVKKDYVEALKWYRKAAEQGDGYSMCAIGSIYYGGGHGVKQDDVEAMKWYRKSAAQDYYGGDLRLGWCYRDGRGVKQDFAEAMKLFLRAADRKKKNGVTEGHVPSSIADMYRDGAGVKQDPAEAVKWYRKAADQSDYLKAYALKEIEKLLKQIEENKKAEPEKK